MSSDFSYLPDMSGEYVHNNCSVDITSVLNICIQNIYKIKKRYVYLIMK